MKGEARGSSSRRTCETWERAPTPSAREGPSSTRRKVRETVIEYFVATVGPRSSLWVRWRRKTFRSTFNSTFKSASAGRERCRQLAIQHYIYGGDAPRGDCWQYGSIRRFGKWGTARRRFELF